MAIPKRDFSSQKITGPGRSNSDQQRGSMDMKSQRKEFNNSEASDISYNSFGEERFKHSSEHLARSAAYKLNFTPASKFTSKEREWLFPNFLAKGELTLLAGPPSSGKSFIACYLAAAITNEHALSYNSELINSQTGNVLYIATEDSNDGTLKLRLEAAGANLDYIHLEGDSDFAKDKKPFSFNNSDHIESLRQMNRILEGQLNLIVIDPIYQAVDKDFKSSVKSRLAYEKLAKLARELNCAILGIAHTVKSPQGKKALQRITSPTSLQEVPRTILVTAEIKNRPTSCGGNFVLVRAKSSNSSPGGGFEYDICVPSTTESSNATSARFEIKKILEGYADDILHTAEQAGKAKTPRKQDLAKDILIEHLSDGKDMSGTELIQIAEESGISENTLKIAKRELGIASRKRLGDGRSMWFKKNPMIDIAKG